MLYDFNHQAAAAQLTLRANSGGVSGLRIRPSLAICVRLKGLHSNVEKGGALSASESGLVVNSALHRIYRPAVALLSPSCALS